MTDSPGRVELSAQLRRQLRGLEERLLQPKVRRSRSDLDELLSPDFIEFGSSGKVYDKEQVIEALTAETSEVTGRISRFRVRELAKGVALVTYTFDPSTAAGRTHRSSIWTLADGRWRVVFHQGTPASEPTRR